MTADNVASVVAQWTGVPVKAARQRGKFVRAALRDALRGLDALHAAGLVHQGLGPSAVLLSTEDDFNKGSAARGALQELGFARDAASLYPAHWVSTDGLELSPYGEAAEAGNAARPACSTAPAFRSARRAALSHAARQARQCSAAWISAGSLS